jgi:four helix bundle protein
MRREIHERVFRLALKVATLRTEPVFKRMAADHIVRQLLRSTTSVGANLEESTAAQSRADFASKVSIATKEAREMQYWLRLGHESGVLSDHEWEALRQECAEIARIVSTIARTAHKPADRKSELKP